MEVVYSRPVSQTDRAHHYCTGCGHGIVHKMLAQIIDELGIQDKSIIVAPVGCSVLIYNYFETDGLESAHGRAPAVATGLKRVQPDKMVIVYQGDGDLLAIGTAETIHAANRGENFSVIYINNAIYGMTGGQMAPTSMEGQKTKTSPYGRKAEDCGLPITTRELLATLEAPVYIERCSVDSVKNTIKTKKAMKKALTNQIENKGFSFVEILSMCPTGWGMRPPASADWVRDVMIPYYPLGNFRDK